ncbi:uncharacterized protein LOC142329026 [Lycorma delicatula]|uniref:uncharacterized protein LOC142329026 n=1 Tax=Lycorma delicatula TaxID=130591 RepID=UPI003F5117DD
MSVNHKKCLLEIVLNKAVSSGRFGDGMEILRYEKDSESKTGDQFASSIVFIKAVMNSSSGGETRKEYTFALVVKFQPESLKVRETMNSCVQFHNENVMYSHILPFLDFNEIISSLFPKFYYGVSGVDGNNSDESIIVVEDLRDKNFLISKLRVFLDYNHIILALKALGKFHALSYIAKQKDPIMFNEMKMKLIEHSYSGLNNFIGPCALRGIKALSNRKNSIAIEKLIKKIEDDAVGLMKYLITPEEPSAVICHGDFCNHNVLFKYDNESPDIPTSIRFFDLQTSRYASPVIDLSMILLLNTQYELRSCHWDNFILTYYNSLQETVTAAGCAPPSFEQLSNELKNKLFYGYFHCSYFLPMLTSDEGPPDVETTSNLSPEEITKTLCSTGGDKGTEYLLLIVKHLEELGCLPS